MAKFDFQGKLFEQGRRVITGVINAINIRKLAPSDNPSGTLNVITDQEGRSSLEIELSLPQGEKGDTPTVEVGAVQGGAAGTSPIVTTSDTDTGVALNFTIPQGNRGERGAQGLQGIQGVQGEPGYTPKVEVVQRIETLEPGAAA